MKMINKNKIFLFFILFLSAGILFASEFKRDLGLQVSFLDVGQGDSIYIKAFGKTDMLIDGGRNGDVLLQNLSVTMGAFDNQIDILVITHPDEDHSGGLVSVVRDYKIGAIFISGNISDNKNYNQILKIAESEKIPTFKAEAGTNIYLDKDKKVVFEILSPTGEVLFEESNSTSILGRLVYDESEFMLTGDAGIDIEGIVLKEGRNIDSDVLKLGHHGSKTSSSINFLKAVDPEVVIISAGENNSYGHPHKEVMDRVNSLGIRSLATYDLGIITFLSDGEKIYLDN